MNPRYICFSACLLIASCGTDSNEESLVSIPLAGTRLVGAYTLVNYLFEYGDGTRYDPSILKLTGTLNIGPDSSYLEGIRVGNDSTPTQGKVTGVRVGSDKDKGELDLTLVSGDSTTSNISTFSFRKDTLVLVTEVSKESDNSKKGFRETDYFLPDSLVTAP